MKKNIFYLVIAISALVLGASCTDDEPNVTVNIGDQNGGTDTVVVVKPGEDKILKGKITEDNKIGAGETWILEGIVEVEEGATLTIERGATLIANPDDGTDALIIFRGAKIMAEGTATQPIVMTSTKRERGSFGGLVILGRAPINVPGGESSSELGDEYKYGGNDPEDNSGVLKYVRIEYAGKRNTQDKEFNGFSLYAVGSGTVMENLQAYYGSDDGFEFFGGTVVANNLISTGNEDDAIDWNEGWTGGGENWLVELAEDDGDYGFESSGNDDTPTLQPYSKPVIKNVTIKGSAIAVTEEKSAIRLKSGTNIDIENLVIMGYPKGIRIDKAQSVNFLKDGEMSIKNVKFGNDVITKYVNKSDVAEADFNAAIANITEDENATGATVGDSRGKWALELIGGGSSSEEKVLTGTITQNKIIGVGETWVLDGIVKVQEGVTLTIGRGATIVANPDDGTDALIIFRGAKIMAEGTAVEPIVMTSTKHERGSFGGLVILGRAPINVPGGESSSELGDEYKYGGDDPEDNSGVLKYVRIEYAGKRNTQDKEFNGFSLYAVGRGTTMENLQAYFGSDDGFEFFGGTVVANNLISTGNEDDAIDWNEGWIGGGENWLVELAEDDGDFGFESSGNDDTPTLEPYSKPVIKNVTIKGNQICFTEEKSAIRLKSGTNIDIENLVIMGYPKGIRFDKDQTLNFLKNGEMTINKVRFERDVTTKYINKSGYSEADFNAAIANITEDATATGATVGDDRGSWALELPGGAYTPPATPVAERFLKGDITEDKIIPAGEEWKLEGNVRVKEGATLTIQRGVKLVANPDDGTDALFIERGAKIMAEGTAKEPIVMTSTVLERGSFGGLVILGRAPINVPGGESSSELGTEYKYGGNDPDDNSGVLKYVRIEYAGKRNTQDKEFNGFSLYAVGRGTKMENLQAYYGSDDGFEFFGGTVVANNLISTGNEDDAIDWNEGWTGGGENWIVEIAEDDGDFGFEASGNDDAPTVQPYSKPVIKNVTIKGNAISVTEEKSAIRLKSGTNIDLQNVMISGYPRGIRFDKDQSVDFLKNGEMVLKQVKFGSDVTTKYINKSDYSEADFNAAIANIEEDENATGATISNRSDWALDL